MLLVPLLLACNGPTIDGEIADGEGAGAELPEPYVYEADGDDPATFDQALVEGALQDAVDLVLSLHGGPVLEGYFAMIARSDEDCPSWYEKDGNVFWYDLCTAQDGTEFDGYGFYYPYDQVDLDGSGTLWSGDYLYGVATISGADGTRFHAGGGVQVLEGYGEEEGVNTAMSQVAGGFEWTEAEGGSDWMAEGLVPDMYLYSVEYPEYDGRGVYVEGGVSGMGSDDTAGQVTAALFDAAFLFSESLGSVCEREPAGSAQIRDADGRWWLVTFDTPDEGDMDTALCDGCGTVSFNGEEVGSACADFSPWLQWEVRPW